MYSRVETGLHALSWSSGSYPLYKKSGFYIGSGVLTMESGCDQSDKLSVLDGDVEVNMSVFQLFVTVLVQ